VLCNNEKSSKNNLVDSSFSFRGTKTLHANQIQTRIEVVPNLCGSHNACYPMSTFTPLPFVGMPGDPNISAFSNRLNFSHPPSPPWLLALLAPWEPHWNGWENRVRDLKWRPTTPTAGTRPVMRSPWPCNLAIASNKALSKQDRKGGYTEDSKCNSSCCFGSIVYLQKEQNLKHSMSVWFDLFKIHS